MIMKTIQNIFKYFVIKFQMVRMKKMVRKNYLWFILFRVGFVRLNKNKHVMYYSGTVFISFFIHICIYIK